MYQPGTGHQILQFCRRTVGQTNRKEHRLAFLAGRHKGLDHIRTGIGVQNHGITGVNAIGAKQSRGPFCCPTGGHRRTIQDHIIAQPGCFLHQLRQLHQSTHQGKLVKGESYRRHHALEALHQFPAEPGIGTGQLLSFGYRLGNMFRQNREIHNDRALQLPNLILQHINRHKIPPHIFSHYTTESPWKTIPFSVFPKKLFSWERIIFHRSRRNFRAY